MTSWNRKRRFYMEQEKQQVHVNREYKDRLFRKLFGDEKALLSLYNAVNRTDYKDPNLLQVNTLEGVVYMTMKNDVSFVIDCELNLYEQQSTYNPNMPLRNLFYISRLLETMIHKRSLYSNKLLTLPTPRFIVFYNGDQDAPEEAMLKLSSAFEKHEGEPELELMVRVLNINKGFNQELLEQCQMLKEYVLYVDKVRKYAKEMGIEDAVEAAVNESLREGVLTDFLTRYRKEAIQMSIFEYNEEEELALLRQEEREEGRKEEKKKAALNMNHKGLSIELIAEIVEVGVDTVKQWIENS